MNNYDLSNYLRTVSELTMAGKKFKDPEFAPGKSALLGDGSNKDGLKWLVFLIILFINDRAGLMQSRFSEDAAKFLVKKILTYLKAELSPKI